MMGTLWRTVSKLFVSNMKHTFEATELHSSSSSPKAVDTSSVDGIAPDAEKNPSNNSCDRPSKRKSSLPEVSRRSCDDDDSDSGVEKDRSPKEEEHRTRNSSGRETKQLPQLPPSNGSSSEDHNHRHRLRRKSDQQVEGFRSSQVNFEQDVVVHKAFIDEDGNRTSFCDREKLKLGSARRHHRVSRSDNDATTTTTTIRGPPTFLTTEVDFQTTEPDIRFRIDRDSRTGARLLRFCVRLGSAFSGGAAVMVKTNSACNEVHLMAHRAVTVSSSRTSYSKSKSSNVYQTSFPLPVVIDAGSLTAIVDTDGRVLIEARVVAPADPLLERWYGRHRPVSKKKSSSAEASKGVRREKRRIKHGEATEA